jgi:hypothetical protein
MTPAEILSETARRGIRLWADGSTLRFYPKKEMPPFLASELKGSKAAVLAALMGAADEPNTVLASSDEIGFWIGCLRDAGCRIELLDGIPAIEWSADQSTPGRLRDWQANLPQITAVLQAEAAAQQPAQTVPVRRLIENGFTPRYTNSPPESIRAMPTVVCPRCTARPVLRELREMTGGHCYPCWEAEARS